MSTYYKTKRSLLPTWFTNFVAVADLNKGFLGLDGPAIAALEARLTALNNAAAAREAAATAAKGATQTLDAEVTATLAVIAGYANAWQASGTVSDSLIAELGLTVRDTTPTPRPVFTPSDLTVTPNATGTNWVRWKRNGNLQGIKFDLEVAYDGSDNWTAVTTVTAASFKHQGQTPGRMTAYRVRARNRGIVSDWLTGTAFYAGEPQLQVAA